MLTFIYHKYVLELARRKLECYEYNYDQNRSQPVKDVSKLSDKERFEKNRRRRLLKEQEDKKKEEEAKCPIQTCDVCKEELSLPLKVYICQDGHIHREAQGRNKNKKVNMQKSRNRKNHNKYFQFCSACCGPSQCRLVFMRKIENKNSCI